VLHMPKMGETVKFDDVSRGHGEDWD